MKSATVIVKVTLEVQIPIELEDDDNRTPAEAAKYDLENTAVSDWWRQLNANWTIDKVEPTSVVNHNEEARAPWECDHDFPPNQMTDMQGRCTKCGAPEE